MNCLSQIEFLFIFIDIFSTVESSKMFSVSGEERTVRHAKYPASIAEKNTKMNLIGHIFLGWFLGNHREEEERDE